MAKTKKSQNNQNKQKQKKKGPGPVQLPGAQQKMALSPPLVEYAKLLSNPCNGPLVHAPGSTQGGMLTRFESDFLIGTGATDTCGFMLFTPGAINGAAPANGSGTLVGVAASDTTAVTPSSGGVGTYLPGKTYLDANASSYRCVAMCVQIYWPGSELDRQGIVSGAQGTYALLRNDSGTTVGLLRSACPVVERIPTECFEVKWAPNYTDGLFRSPKSTNPPEDGHASLLITWAGLPATKGVRVRAVAVYEWLPIITGLTLNSNTSTGTAGDVQKVRQVLDKADANWWHRSGQAALHFASGMVTAYVNARGPNFPGQGRPRIEL